MKKVYCIVIGFTLMALATSSLGYCDDEEGFRWIPYADYDYVMKFKLGRLVSNESDGSLQGFQWLITMGDHYYSPYNKLPQEFLSQVDVVYSAAGMDVFKVITPEQNSIYDKEMAKISSAGGYPFIFPKRGKDGFYRFLYSKEYFLVAELKSDVSLLVKQCLEAGVIAENGKSGVYTIYDLLKGRNKLQSFVICPIPEVNVILMAESKKNLQKMIETGQGLELALDSKEILAKFALDDSLDSIRWLYRSGCLYYEKALQFTKDNGLDMNMWDNIDRYREDSTLDSIKYIIFDETFQQVEITRMPSSDRAREAYEAEKDVKLKEGKSDPSWVYSQNKRVWGLDNDLIYETIEFDDKFFELATKYRTRYLEERRAKKEAKQELREQAY